MVAITSIGDVLNDAIDLIASRPSTEGLVSELRYLLNVDHIIYTTSTSVIDPKVRPLIRTTYPAEWLKRYADRSYDDVDPVLKRGYASALPFKWSEMERLEAAAIAMMSDAARHGVGPNGLSIPVVVKTGRRGLFSVAGSGSADAWDNFYSINMSFLSKIAYTLHNKVMTEILSEPILRLSAREVECLSWSARGKEASDIALILGLSLHTVRDYLKSARFKLGCSNLPQAVAKAVAHGLISGS